MALQRLEVLVYQNDSIEQPIFNREFEIIARLQDEDLVFVVGDENRPYIKVMTASLVVGWTYYNRNFCTADCVEIRREER